MAGKLLEMIIALVGTAVMLREIHERDQNEPYAISIVLGAMLIVTGWAIAPAGSSWRGSLTLLGAVLIVVSVIVLVAHARRPPPARR